MLWPKFVTTPEEFRDAIVHTGPNADRSVENFVLDFKERFPSKPWKMAKTVAAFANANGGVILIGIAERTDPRGRKYADQLVNTPATVVQRVSQAVNTHLSPPTLDYQTLAIQATSADVVVAVNIQPHHGIIAMRGDQQPAPAGAVGNLASRWLAYPYRRDDHTYWMETGDVERHLLNPNRARRLQLHSMLHRAKSSTIHLLFSEGFRVQELHDPAGDPNDPQNRVFVMGAIATTFLLRKTRDTEAVFGLTGTETDSVSPTNSIAIPYSALVHMWLDPDERTITVQVSGKLVRYFVGALAWYPVDAGP